MTAKASGDVLAVSIVSNSQLILDGLPLLLKNLVCIDLIGCYKSEVLGSSLCNRPDHIALIDFNIGQELTVAWTRWWREQAPPTQVVVLDVANDFPCILACIQAGAGAYTLQGTSPAEVAKTIVDLDAGVVRCSPEVTAMLFAYVAEQQASPAQTFDMPLTGREMQILECIAQGQSNKEIASRLNIELYTVKHHVHHILEKLNLRGRWQAVQFARQQGWLMHDEKVAI